METRTCLDRVPPYPVGLDEVLESGTEAQYASIVPPPAHHQMESALDSSSVGSFGTSDTTQTPTGGGVINPSQHTAHNNTHGGNLHGEINEAKKQVPLDTERHYKLVQFAEGDPGNPKNWSKAYKWWCTMVVAVTCFVVAFTSSVITADIASVSNEFGVSYEAGLVSITVFVVGFGVGTLFLSYQLHTRLTLTPQVP